MTKKTITEILPGDYISDLDGCTAWEAIEYFKKLPITAMLDMNWTGYEEVQGDITITREETAEEYSYRLQCEMEALEAARKKAEKKRVDDQKNIDMTLAQLQKQMDELLKVRPK